MCRIRVAQKRAAVDAYKSVMFANSRRGCGLRLVNKSAGSEIKSAGVHELRKAAACIRLASLSESSASSTAPRRAAKMFG